MSTISICAQFVRDLKELTVIDENAVGTFYFNENNGFTFGIIFNEVDKLSNDSDCEKTIAQGFKQLFTDHTITIKKDECGLYFEVN